MTTRVDTTKRLKTTTPRARTGLEDTDGKFLRSVASFVPGDGRSRVRIRERLFHLATLIDIHSKTGQLLQAYTDELQKIAEEAHKE